MATEAPAAAPAATEPMLATEINQMANAMAGNAYNPLQTVAMFELTQLQLELLLKGAPVNLGAEHDRYGSAEHKKLLRRARESTEAAIRELKKRQKASAARQKCRIVLVIHFPLPAQKPPGEGTRAEEIAEIVIKPFKATPEILYDDVEKNTETYGLVRERVLNLFSPDQWVTSLSGMPGGNNVHGSTHVTKDGFQARICLVKDP